MRIHVVRGSSVEEIDLTPSKVVCVGTNYRAHAVEMGKAIPEEPVLFLKPPSAIIGHGEAIERPLEFAQVHHEGELGVVIGTRCKNLSADSAMDVVMGFTCVNDVSVRELQKKDGQWLRAKGFDTFCPIGPRIVAGLDPTNLRLVTRVNGVVKQDSSTADMVFGVRELLVFITRYMTLEVGDVISTGTPSGVGPFAVGDTVEIDIEGIGTLSNPVVARA